MSRMYLLILYWNLLSNRCDTLVKHNSKGKPPYNYVQLGLVGAFVILTCHQLRAAQAWWKICASERGNLFIQVQIPLYLKLPDCMPYMCTVYIYQKFISPALRNGLTPPRHQCQSDEWVSNSVWSLHQRRAALNAQPWEKAGRGKDFIGIRDEEGEQLEKGK